jgi:hypothetical protein
MIIYKTLLSLVDPVGYKLFVIDMPGKKLAENSSSVKNYELNLCKNISSNSLFSYIIKIINNTVSIK